MTDREIRRWRPPDKSNIPYASKYAARDLPGAHGLQETCGLHRRPGRDRSQSRLRFWGPHIRGVNVELIKNKRIVQAWRTLKLAGGPLLHRHVRPQAGKVRDGAGFQGLPTPQRYGNLHSTMGKETFRYVP